MFCSISTTILHKPLHALVDLICSLHTRGEPNNETQQRKKEKEPHIAPVKRRSPSNRLTLASILLIYVSFYFLNFSNFLFAAIIFGTILWYTTRANTSYCFVCSSPTSCTHTKLKNNPNPNSSSYGQAKISISWKVSLAKCVDSSPLVVGYSLEEDGGREGSRIICYVGSHKGMVVAVEGISTSFFFFSFSCLFLLFISLDFAYFFVS